MRNSILFFSLIALIITTAIIKNSSKNLENQIFITNENINILKNKYELVLLEFNFLTSPKQLLDYQKSQKKKYHLKVLKILLE